MYITNINELPNEIFQYIKKYVNENSVYSPNVVKSAINIEYPSVVFQTNANTLNSQNQGIYKLDIVRNLSFAIDIYAIKKGNIDSSIICDELSNIVNYVMQEMFGMQGGIDNRIFNINTSGATQYVLHYNCLWNVKKNNIY